VKKSSVITAYVGDGIELRDELNAVQRLANEIKDFAGSVEKKETKEMIELYESVKQLFAESRTLIIEEQKRNSRLNLVAPLNCREIPEGELTDPRAFVSAATASLATISGKVDDLRKTFDSLLDLRSSIEVILGFSQPVARGPLCAAFNELKDAVERSYATNGVIPADPAVSRCRVTLDQLFELLNPAPELRRSLSELPQDLAAVASLSAILEYLDEHGPLFQNSASHEALSRFIRECRAGDVTRLVSLATEIEFFVPENLKNLAEACDPSKRLYKELDGDLDPHDLTRATQACFDGVVRSAEQLEKALKSHELEVTAKYRALNLRLWRIVVLFDQFAADCSPGSIGYTTFREWRKALAILIEEAAYDMKRDFQFMPFIDEFTQKIDAIVMNPLDSRGLAGFGEFLMLHQSRPGFYRAAQALSSFNHFVIVSDSNRAVDDLARELAELREFRSVSLMIANLKSRFIALLRKLELAMKSTIDVRRNGVDLRSDFTTFLRKFTSEMFIIFTRLIVVRCRNRDAIQDLSHGCEAIEVLFPVIMNVEAPAPYLGRSVCGLVFSSLDAITVEAHRIGGSAADSSDKAFLTVREFLFNIRRKVAESESETLYMKTGIGIADMLAVIERDKKVMSEQVEFQRSIRKLRQAD
jgi:hypothetical protein